MSLLSNIVIISGFGALAILAGLLFLGGFGGRNSQDTHTDRTAKPTRN